MPFQCSYGIVAGAVPRSDAARTPRQHPDAAYLAELSAARALLTCGSQRRSFPARACTKTTEQGTEAIQQCLVLELDTTDSAKAALAIARLRANVRGPVLFWSTKSTARLPEGELAAEGASSRDGGSDAPSGSTLDRRAREGLAVDRERAAGIRLCEPTMQTGSDQRHDARGGRPRRFVRTTSRM